MTGRRFSTDNNVLCCVVLRAFDG